MAELPLDQAVPRFKENEDRLDTFVNSATGYTTSGGVSVQSIQQFLASIGSNGIDFVDNAKARFGTGNDLEIYHSGTESYIDEKGTGSLRIRSAGSVVIEGIDGTNSILADTDAEVQIYYNGVKKLETTSTGIDVFGTVEFNGLSGTGAVTITDIADEDNMASNSATKLATQQSIKAYVDAQVGTADTLSEVLGLGNTTGGTDIAVSANDDITFTDSSKAKFGASSDLQIYHDGSNSYIKEVGTGNLFIDATTLYVSSDIGIGRVAGAYTFTEVNGGNERAGMHSNASNELIFKTGVATERMKLTSTGLDVTGVTTSSSGYQFGTQDAWLYQGATDNVTLRVGGTGSYRYFQFTDTSSGSRIGTAGGALYLAVGTNDYLNIDTSGNVTIPSGNLDVTGTVEFDGLSGTGAVTVTDILDEDDMTSDSATALATQQSIKAYVDANAGGGSGGLPTTGGTMTGDILFNDGVKAKYGTSSDLQIFHDGSDSYIKDSGTGILFLRTNQLKIQSDDGLETYGVFTDNGAVTLYHNNVEKLATTSSGIDVTGNVVGDGLTIAGDATFTGGGTGSIVINDEDSSLCPTMTFTRNGGGTTTNDFIKFENSGGEVANIDSTGGALFRELKVKGSNTRRIDISNTTLADTGEMATLQWDNSANFTIQGRTSAGGFAANWYSIQTSDTDGRADAHIFYTDASTERMRIDSGGIDVTGNIGLSSTQPTITLTDTDGPYSSYIAKNGSVLTVDGDSVRVRSTAGTEYMRVTSAGIDVTGSTNTDTLNVSTGTTGWLATMSNPTASGNGLQINAGDNAGDRILQLADKDGNEAMRVTGERKVGINNSSPSALLEIGNGDDNTLGTTAGDVLDNLHITSDTSNSDKLLIQAKRTATGTSWTSAAQRLQRKVDTTLMGYMQYGSASSDLITFGKGASTEYMRIDSSGKVGIGTTAQTSQLHIKGNNVTGGIFVEDASDSNPSPVIKVQGQRGDGNGSQSFCGGLALSRLRSQQLAGNNTHLGTIYFGTNHTDGTAANISYSASIAAKLSGNANSASDMPTDLVFYTGSTGNDLGLAGNNKYGTERMRIDASGDVSIASGNLSVTGRIAVGDADTVADHELHIQSASPTIRLEDTDGNQRFDITQNGGTTNVDYESGVIFKKADATEIFRIDGAGIDVTGDLTVSSTIEVGSLTPAQDGAIEVGVIALGTPAIASTTDSTGLRNHIIFDNPNGVVGKINTINSATSYLTSSDYRLKTDVQAMTGSIDRVKALRPVNFEWVVDGTRVDGFLAHEAQEIVPEAVDGEKDAMRDQQYVESEATGDIYTPAVKATYETIQVELTPAVEAVYETVTVEISPAVDAVYKTITVEISPAVEATYDDDGNELTPAVEAITEEQEQLVTPAVEAVTEEQEQLVTPAVDATYEEQQQELTPAIDEVIHSSDVVEPDELEEGQLWRETTEKVMATRQVPDYQGIDQSKIVPLLTSALQDAIAKIEALEIRLEALEG